MPISAKAKGRERRQVQNECKIVKIAMLSDLHRVIGFPLQFNFYFVQNIIYRWFEEKFKTVSTPVALRDLRDLNCV